VINVFSDLENLYRERGVAVSDEYSDVTRRALHRFLPYGSDAMYGIILTLFRSRQMIAFNLVQNSIDEAKGAARISLIANRYADTHLRDKMMRHVAEEMKHSRQFANLIALTGFDHGRRDEEPMQEEITDVLEFDDDLKQFICRVHSIEIRSWTVLRYYRNAIRDLGLSEIEAALPVLDSIMEEEMGHVLYTGEQINTWLQKSTDLLPILEGCFQHTSRETWVDLANMSTYLSKHSEALGVDGVCDNPGLSLGGPQISLLG
jgi:hypothetical protein